MIEMGEMFYGEVDESELDQSIRDNMSMDDWIEVAKEGGQYMCGAYEVRVCTPHLDVEETNEHEVFIEAEEAMEHILDEFDRLQARLSTMSEMLRASNARIQELEKDEDKDEISQITQAISA